MILMIDNYDFVDDSKVGIMGIESLNTLGLTIPNDIAVVSFDDPDERWKIAFKK